MSPDCEWRKSHIHYFYLNLENGIFIALRFISFPVFFPAPSSSLLLLLLCLCVALPHSPLSHSLPLSQYLRCTVSALSEMKIVHHWRHSAEIPINPCSFCRIQIPHIDSLFLFFSHIFHLNWKTRSEYDWNPKSGICCFRSLLTTKRRNYGRFKMPRIR